MFVTHRPEDAEDSDPGQDWEFRPRRVKASRGQMIERAMKQLTGDTVTFTQFQVLVAQGSAPARRVLLWHLQSLTHPTTRIEDVDPTEDELTIDQSKSELEEMRAAIKKSGKLDPQSKEMMLEALDEQLETAPDDGGKAPSRSLPTSTP